MEYGVIMAGGSGTRLWPLSRNEQPKQLLSIVRGKSLLQLAYDRLRGMMPPSRILVCTAEKHRAAVLKNLPELPPENLLGEPQPRDTVNAVGFSAAVLHKKDPDAIFAIVTADHVIEPVDSFQRAIRDGFAVTHRNKEALVTFGIVPTYGHTGLGYIQRGDDLPGFRGAYRVQAFKEKPDKPTADRYVESGKYYWNSGMFVWRADAVLSGLKRFLPSVSEGLARIEAAWGTADQDAVLREVYPTLTKISVDYALMEPAAAARQVVVVEMPVDWLDVGSWPALAETLTTDDHDNAIDATQLVQLDSDGNIIVNRGDGHLLALIGVSDMVVVRTEDCTLICPKAEAERVKDMVAKVKEKFGDRYQ
jgi:mannose-1-phosphate guanylyltransferase